MADRLDIPYYVLNFREVFEERVIKDFVNTYASGRTPNPCIRCNQFIKFDALRVKARQLGAEHELSVVPDATHLFPEPGALDEVARLATAWFVRTLVPPLRT